MTDADIIRERLAGDAGVHLAAWAGRGARGNTAQRVEWDVDRRSGRLERLSYCGMPGRAGILTR